MILKNEYRVYYQDTDAYKVVWHGAYLRYMEAARVEFCEKAGMFLSDLQNLGVIFPVIDLNIRYKVSAKLDDLIIVETSIEEIKPSNITFKQIIKNKQTEIENICAYVKIVAVNNDGKMFRKIPEEIMDKFKKVMMEK